MLGVAQTQGAEFERLSIATARSELELAAAKHREEPTDTMQRDLAQARHVLGIQLCAFGTIQLLIDPLEEGVGLLGEAAGGYPPSTPALDLQPQAWQDRAESQFALARLLAARGRGPDGITALHDAVKSYERAASLHGEENASDDRLALAKCWGRIAHAHLRLAEKTGGRHHYLAAVDRLEDEAAVFRSMAATPRTVQGWAHALREAARVLTALADISGEEEHHFRASMLLEQVEAAVGEVCSDG